MAEISPHQGSESQWIEALLFLPISEILSLTWEIVVDPDYTFLGIETFLKFPILQRASFLASSFFSGTSRNRAGSKNQNQPIKHLFPCSRHSRSKASRPPASLCGNAFHDLQLFPTSSFFTRHLGEPAGLTQRKESSLGQN